MDDVNISASLLLKNSAKKVVWIKSRKGKFNQAISSNKEKGTKSQFKNSKSNYVEMAGKYSYGKYNIYYSFDEIRIKDDKDIFIEHKLVEGKLPKWFLEYSVLQVALYQSLAHFSSTFSTAKFHVNNGNPNRHINCDSKRLHRLVISNGKSARRWSVRVTNHKKILDFYKNKHKATIIGNLDIDIAYNNAVKWDEKYYRKEFDMLKNYIKYKEIT